MPVPRLDHRHVAQRLARGVERSTWARNLAAAGSYRAAVTHIDEAVAELIAAAATLEHAAKREEPRGS